jgi:hypothetical protein
MGLITQGGLGNGLGASLQVRDEDNFAWANVVSMYELLPNVIGFWPMSNSTPAVAKFVPLTTALTSTSWDGDAKTTDDNGTIDLSAVFGVPAGIKAALVSMTVKDETTQVWSLAGPLQVWTIVANNYNSGMGIVPCDANGDFSWACGSELDYVALKIHGYWL